jgi:fructose-bisphosphate aldolase class II
MKIINERMAVLERLSKAGETRIPLLCPNAETPEEMIGILLGAQRHAEACGLTAITIGIGVTATYPDHPQLGLLGMPGADLCTTAKLWLRWLQNCADCGIFERVEAIPFIDHGWVPAEQDRQLMEQVWFQDAMGIIMHDASLYDFSENARLTSEYVERAGQRVVIEACPDKVYERAEIERKNLQEAEMLSDPDSVARFVAETGVDLVVPNLGTEHRTQSKVPLEYRRELAQALSSRIGPRLALHGTSSLGDRLQTVGQDGICKVNFYTAMTREASEHIKEEWNAVDPAAPLPISLASGAAIHAFRRDVFAKKTQAMLELLSSP